DVDLPDIQYMSETISGAGIAGEIDSPTLGHFSALEIGLNLRTLIKKDFSLFSQKVYALEFRAATQSTDMVNGTINKGRLKVSARVVPKS
ncbi:phage major tail tube protein, partial [Fusobacterium necrophorum]